MIKIGGILESLLQIKYITRNYDSSQSYITTPSSKRYINTDIKSCDSCGLCESVCITNAITVDEKSVNINEKCILCRLCISVCPKGALSEKIINEEETADEKKL